MASLPIGEIDYRTRRFTDHHEPYIWVGEERKMEDNASVNKEIYTEVVSSVKRGLRSEYLGRYIID